MFKVQYEYMDNTLTSAGVDAFPLDTARPLCVEGYIYCTLPIGVEFPSIPEVHKQWYDFLKKQLEFRKYRVNKKCPCCGQEKQFREPYTGWMVSPVAFEYDGRLKRYPQVQMKDADVLKLWLAVYQLKGSVSDSSNGITNLFG